MIITLLLALVGAIGILGLAAVLASGNGKDIILCDECGEKCDHIAQNILPDGIGEDVYKCPKCGKIYKMT